jgi:endonuclease/exonuclease/phosphatase family metal-dependent hydrolase
MTTLRAMTFNIYGAPEPHEGIHSWQSRADLNVEMIQRYAPDLIGFQEVIPASFATYQKRLTPEYDYVEGMLYGEDEEPGYIPIFWKEAAFELVESGKFWYSRTPDVMSADWNVPYPLGATWAKLQHVESGAYVILLNTHFEDGPDGELSRAESSRLLVDRLVQLQGGRIPVIVTGDFNCNPGDPAYITLTTHGLVDCFLAAGNEEGAATTFHGFEGEQYDGRRWGGAEQFWRIDWIMVHGGAAGVHVKSCIVLKDAEPPLYPSDHYPVLAELELIRDS